MYTGSCLCGSVSYEISGELQPIQICHCQMCRTAQGSAFATNTPVSSKSFRIVSGQSEIKEYESSPGKYRAFCGKCGSPIYSRRDDAPEGVRIRAGLLNEAVPMKPIAHFYTASKANWWEINDSLPKFPEAYVPREKNGA